jgi:hypothetical protein
LGKRFNTAVADALYANAYTISPAVKAIVSAGVRRICTYNFDDLLEEALTVHGVPFESLGPGDKELSLNLGDGRGQAAAA